MPIYTCPKCNNKYYLDDNQNLREFKCKFCGTEYTKTEIVEMRNTIVEQPVAKEKNTITEKKSVLPSDTHVNNTSVQSVTNIDELLRIGQEQLNVLKSIKSMVKFFTVLTIISLIFAFIAALNL